MKINKQIFLEMISKDYFNEWKTMSEILKKLDSMGYSVKGRKISRIAQLLTQLCRLEVLERERLSPPEWKTARGKFKYRKKSD